MSPIPMLPVLACWSLLSFGASVAAGADAGPARPVVERFAVLPADVRHPEGLAVDPASGEVYVGTFDAREPASTRNNVLLRLSPRGDEVARITLGATPLTGIEVRDGAVYVLNFGAGRLQRAPLRFVDGATITDVATFTTLAPPAPTPRDVANPDGSTDRLVFGSAGMPAPNGMVFDRAGNLFVSDSFQGAILRIADATRCSPCAVTVVSRDPLLATTGYLPFGANGLAFDADEKMLYVTNAGDGRLLRMAMPGGAVEIVAESVHGADGLMRHGDLFWIASNQADAIVGLDASGRVRVRAGGFDGIARDGTPRGLLFPASTAVQGDWIIVTNLALPLTPRAGDEWEEDVTRWTLARFRLPR